MENEVETNSNVQNPPKEPKTKWWIYIIQYISALIVGIGFLFAILGIQDYWSNNDPVQKLTIIANAFTIPGIVFLGVGLMIAISNEGVFKGVKFIIIRLGAFLLPFTKLKDKKYEDLLNEKKINGYLFIIVTGAVFIIVALIIIFANNLY